MPPKTPKELKEQLSHESEENPPAEGHDPTPEGLEVETPTRKEFFDNLEQVSRPDDQGNGEKANKPEGSNPDPSI
jgi:hypothetical protein